MRIKNENLEDKINKGIKFISKLSNSKKEKLIRILRQVQKIQNSNLSKKEKIVEIKRIMWTDQSVSSKLTIGALLGAITGLLIFGTGGIGITALGSGIGIWAWLTTAAGGAVIASLIHNFEK